MLCPIDETTLEQRQCGSARYGACPTCHGAWVPASTVKALLGGEAGLSRDALAAATPARSSMIGNAGAWHTASEAARGGKRALPRRYHCADCGALLRMTDPVTHASPCTRCGAVWIQSGGEAAIGAWFRHTLRAGALAMFDAGGTSIPRPRTDGEDATARRTLVLIVASFAVFVVFVPARSGGAIAVRHSLATALGLAGVALVIRGLRHPSRYEIGALTRKGFALALVGAALVVAAILAWR